MNTMMFKLEKEMIPIIQRDIPKFFGDVSSQTEFVSGLGRPDIVFARMDNRVKRTEALPDYKIIDLLIRYFNNKNEVVHIDRILAVSPFSKRKLLSVMSVLIELGLLEQKSPNEYVRKNEYKSLLNNFVSVEAKLSNWQDGLCQAVRYKSFSNSSYLAISEEYLEEVDLALLNYHGIGLISVSPEKARVVCRARKDLPKNVVSHRYLSETFCVSGGLAVNALSK